MNANDAGRVGVLGYGVLGMDWGDVRQPFGGVNELFSFFLLVGGFGGEWCTWGALLVGQGGGGEIVEWDEVLIHCVCRSGRG